MDFLAIVSQGAFPTPTPSGVERAAYVVSRGLLGTFPLVAYSTRVTLTRVVLNTVGMVRVILLKVFSP